uniref:Ubiquitin-associated and SH3 domain-containing protein B n=1 Tax=Schistocephalus solidus TaxID=70667 RepID=A0A0X3Q075_SCHSO
MYGRTHKHADLQSFFPRLPPPCCSALLLITLLTCLITYNAHVVDLWLSHGPAAFSFVARIIAHRDVPFRNLYTFFSLFQRRIFATPLSPHIDFVRALVCL